jgi:hypothetical protein
MRTFIVFVIALAACGDVKELPPDAGATEQRPAPGEVAVAAGRMTGKRLVADVRLGAIESPRITRGTLAADTAGPLVP